MGQKEGKLPACLVLAAALEKYNLAEGEERKVCSAAGCRADRGQRKDFSEDKVRLCSRSRNW